jgi:hypothetical protein
VSSRVAVRGEWRNRDNGAQAATTFAITFAATFVAVGWACSSAMPRFARRHLPRILFVLTSRLFMCMTMQHRQHVHLKAGSWLFAVPGAQ